MECVLNSFRIPYSFSNVLVSSGRAVVVALGSQ